MKRFYLTTAISYPNGSPHIGHAYEAIAADVIARAKKLSLIPEVRLCTGTDEHGLKMVQTARDLGMPVKTLADSRSALFENMNRALSVDFDRFIRTTDPHHHETAQKLWRRMSNDLYLDKYSGWYSVRDEAYFDEDELVVADGGEKFTKDGNPVEWIEEESWFFRLSAYGDRLKQHFADHPDFLQPESSRNEILVMLDDLRDISVSRTTFDWGVPV
ncbi:MAG: methionine--tRNA ligase, partial [Stutzerimonas stutzeri]